MYIGVDSRGLIRVVSDKPFNSDSMAVVRTGDLPAAERRRIIGKRYGGNREMKKPASELRVALVCNWGDQCGIATYSEFLVSAMRPLVQEVKVFAERLPKEWPEEPGVLRCWRRGQPLKGLVEAVQDYAPDICFIQHEYGIFPNAFYYIKLLEGLSDIPHAVVMHSVYEHMDKAVCTAATRHVVVHNPCGAAYLQSRCGHVHLVPHGCVESATEELWNIFQSPYTIVQFGFGFKYKGMDRAIRAVHHLKSSDPKFSEIQYIALVSSNDHNRPANEAYAAQLRCLAQELGVSDNVAIIQGYFTDEQLSSYLRTAKMAIFPYTQDRMNMVYGASGAARIAMSHGIPVIASESHMFDDLDGVLPRPADHLALADEIDRMFSDGRYRDGVVAASLGYVRENSWVRAAEKYIALYDLVHADFMAGTVSLPAAEPCCPRSS